MYDALILAKLQDFDVFNALDIMENESFLKAPTMGFINGKTMGNLRKTTGNYKKTIGKPWESHRKTIGKPQENHRKTIGKP